MSLKNEELTALNEYLDRLSSAYQADFEMLEGMLSHVKTTPLHMAHLSWSLAHFQRAMVDIHKTIKNLQGRLRDIDAGTKI